MPTASQPGRPAVFLDRDGTLIPDHNYLATVDGVDLLPGAGDALAALARAGFALVVVTNQSGIGRGLIRPEVVEQQHERLRERLRPFGVELAAIAKCPHLPETGCACRKPKPGMLLETAGRLGLDLAASFMVGDKPGDIGAGRAAGCRTVLLGTANDDPAGADFTAPDLPAAAAWILGHRAGKVEG
ncbi:MAG: HAD family hydrolase [Lentisphaeria bacterium]